MSPRLSARRLARELGYWRGNGHSIMYQALAEQLRLMLIDGRLVSGVRLPAERELSEALGVSRTTVTSAYAQLRQQRFLQSIRGSGSRLMLPQGQRGVAETTEGYELDFSKAAAPAYPGLVRAYADAVQALPRYLGHPDFDIQGLPELRAEIAAHYLDRGVSTAPEQILVTLGAQHALSLITRTIYAPGERILIEHPTYPHAIDTFLAAGARLLTVPVSHEGGWDIAEAQLLIRRAAPSMAFLMPDFQSPTGASMAVSEREQLAQLASSENVTLIADETTALLDIDRGPLPPLAAFSPNVVSIGSLGKIAWGGLRIGWVRGPRELISRLQQSRPAIDLGTPILEQLAAIRLLRELPAMCANRSRELRAGRDLLLPELGRAFPGWSLPKPLGGMSLWVNIGGSGAPFASASSVSQISSSALALAARGEGLALVPGPRFGIEGAFERFLRLPFTYPEADLREVVGALSRAASSLGPNPAKAPWHPVV
ncbi:PLP-dependent aminotransferase family protein [Acaricomes phytoseiuli]|uniref:MocR-like transcription factor YczR n=1 Tax=Acaricomes phytoseiuli TaxID=291968 RepID=UPI002223525E|nr:PLP-dependent aminotransferase family protein [Acaricomes phytoseiuli]MCW1248775.1 PLP-dependent aminotransferase family protein [Acaricomes phytoseiuli]